MSRGSTAILRVANVRFGSKADTLACQRDVRFAAHKRFSNGLVREAQPEKPRIAPICQWRRNKKSYYLLRPGRTVTRRYEGKELHSLSSGRRARMPACSGLSGNLADCPILTRRVVISSNSHSPVPSQTRRGRSCGLRRSSFSSAYSIRPAWRQRVAS